MAATETTTAGTTRAPTRWREGSSGPGLLDQRIWALSSVRVAPDDPRIARLREALTEGDPVADALAEWVLTTPSGRAQFERAVEHGIDAVDRAPEPLRAFFQVVDAVPPWLDRRTVRLGTETMARVGAGGYVALGAVSLMSGYLGSAAVKPLAMTGALTRMARRRLLETSTFVLDVSVSGELDRFSPGVRSALRVRLMHAIVRRSLAASPRWRSEDWGAPINQHDMAATNLQFSVMYMVGLLAQGFLLSRREREAVMHLWRYVGWISGVREDLLATTFREGVELGWIINGTEQGPDEDSRALAAALMKATSELHAEGLGPVVGALRTRTGLGLSRLVLGERAANELGIPDDAFKYLPLALAPIHVALELVQRTIPGARALSIRLGTSITRSAIERSLAGRPPTFAPAATAG